MREACAARSSRTRRAEDRRQESGRRQRNRPIVGLVIMQGAKKTGDNKWAGTLYNRENGKSYSGTVTVKSKNELDLSGCVAAVLCKTVTWTRIKK